jgi:hypothetical protein
MKISILSVILLAGLLQASECWKQIGDEDAAKVAKSASQNPYHLEGDFNGDGKLDKVNVEASCDNKTVAVFAYINQEDFKFNRYLLTEFPLDGSNVSVKIVKAGVHESVFNASDYKEVKEKTPEGTTTRKTKVLLDLKPVAIGVKNAESSLVVYYWYEKGQKFNHISLED